MTYIIEPSLTPFFAPTSIVVVGATQNPTKLGFGLVRNLVNSFTGPVHFVNPKGGQLFKRPIHTQLADVLDPIDLAILLIPAPFVPPTLVQCGKQGIQAVIIASGGFRETGAAGAALETEALTIAQKYGIRLMGPNCIGILDTHLPLDTTFLPPPTPQPGDVAFLSHSGAMGAAVIDWAHSQGFGLSRLISLGNQVDVNETELLAPVAADPHTRVITLYLEGVGNGRQFVQVARQVTQEKPVLALKVGRHESGQKAVASHTGALAGTESTYDAAFRRAGIIRANTSEELIDWARALAWSPLPSGRHTAILTNAGGPGVTAVDALEGNGLHLAQFGGDTVHSLREVLPPFASLHNPIDMLASASPQQYADCLQIVLADTAVDSILLIIVPPPMYSTGAVAKAIIPVIYGANKPVVIVLMGERMVHEAQEHFRAARVPEYRYAERAAAALAALSQYAEHRAAEPAEPVTRNDVNPAIVEKILAAHSADHLLPTAALNQILTVYGIPTPPVKLAATGADAAALAAEMGFPVALKIASPDITHKSDVGGVQLNLADTTEVVIAFEEMMTKIQSAFPNAHIHGVDVQPMIPDGQEVIIGVVQDPQFGPVLMFGSGGVEVEGLKDVAFALAPITQREAEEMLQTTWAGRKLDGYRQIAATDKTAVLDIIIRLGQLAADFPQLTEIEINPVRVLVKGAWAVDVRGRSNEQ